MGHAFSDRNRGRTYRVCQKKTEAQQTNCFITCITRNVADGNSGFGDASACRWTFWTAANAKISASAHL